MRYCKYCGMPMEDDDRFCTRCGRESPCDSLHVQAQQEGVKSNEAAMAPQDPTGEPEAGLFGIPQRFVLIAAGLAMLVVAGLLFSMLLHPVGDKSGDGAEAVADPAAGGSRATDGAGDGSLHAAAGDPSAASAGKEESPGESAFVENAADAPGDASANSGNPPGKNATATTRESDSAPAGAEKGREKVAGTEEGADSGQEKAAGAGKSAESGRTEAQERQSGTRDDGYGWVVDEDGNDVYYAPDDAVYTDNDQTQVGGDGDLASRSAEGQDPSGTGGGAASESADAVVNAATDNTYILPGSDSRYYERWELENLDDWTMQMAINEIYARHGRKFDTDSVRAYFEGKSWYRGYIDPAVFDGNEALYFNQYEAANRELMAQIRDERAQAAAPAQIQGGAR